MDGACPPGDGAQQVDLTHLLERAAVPEAEGGSAANDENGAAREIGVGDTCDAIGDTGAGGQQGNAVRPRTFCPALSRVHRRLFVPRIHYTTALRRTAFVHTCYM